MAQIKEEPKMPGFINRELNWPLGRRCMMQEDQNLSRVITSKDTPLNLQTSRGNHRIASCIFHKTAHICRGTDVTNRAFLISSKPQSASQCDLS